MSSKLNPQKSQGKKIFIIATVICVLCILTTTLITFFLSRGGSGEVEAPPETEIDETALLEEKKLAAQKQKHKEEFDSLIKAKKLILKQEADAKIKLEKEIADLQSAHAQNLGRRTKAILTLTDDSKVKSTGATVENGELNARLSQLDAQFKDQRDETIKMQAEYKSKQEAANIKQKNNESNALRIVKATSAATEQRTSQLTETNIVKEQTKKITNAITQEEVNLRTTLAKLEDERIKSESQLTALKEENAELREIFRLSTQLNTTLKKLLGIPVTKGAEILDKTQKTGASLLKKAGAVGKKVSGIKAPKMPTLRSGSKSVEINEENEHEEGNQEEDEHEEEHGAGFSEVKINQLTEQ